MSFSTSQLQTATLRGTLSAAALFALFCATSLCIPYGQQPLFGVHSATIENEVDKEKLAKVKAGFLLNFTKFIEWPVATFPEPKSEFIIFVFGRDPLGSALDKAFEGKLVGDHPVVVRRTSGGDVTLAENSKLLDRAQVIFVCDSEAKNVSAIRDAVGPDGCLTVSDIGGFGLQGGMIELTILDGKLAFYINRREVEAAKLVVSSKLLQLGKPVETKGEK